MRIGGFRGCGPIHVRPTRMPEHSFPDTHYEHIPGANHPRDWRDDLRTPELDAFFVCEPATGCLGQWLGPDGPPVQGAILEFLRTCEVHGSSGRLSEDTRDASETRPICHGGLFRGLHLETNGPEDFLRLVCGSGDHLGSGATKRGNQPKRSVTILKSGKHC